MKLRMFSLIGISIGLFLAAIPVLAHHSFMVEFDMRKPVTVVGTVTEVEWANPHISVFLAVKDESGNVTNWRFDAAAPAALERRGWSRTTVKPGDYLIVEGFLARNGRPFGSAASVFLTDGRKINAGSDGVWGK
jgi:hypothetical protein